VVLEINIINDIVLQQHFYAFLGDYLRKAFCFQVVQECVHDHTLLLTQYLIYFRVNFTVSVQLGTKMNWSYNLRSKGQRSRSWQDQICSKITRPKCNFPMKANRSMIRRRRPSSPRPRKKPNVYAVSSFIETNYDRKMLAYFFLRHGIVCICCVCLLSLFCLLYFCIRICVCCQYGEI